MMLIVCLAMLGALGSERVNQMLLLWDFQALIIVFICIFVYPNVSIVADWNLECRTPSGRAVLKNAAAGAKS